MIDKTSKIITICFLFFTLIFSANAQTKNPQATAKKNPNAPEITFENKVYDYGSILKNGNGNTEFVFKNTGKSPLILLEVKPSCNCTSPVWPKEPIMPGKTGTIKVLYDTKEVGVFSKTITVTSNASNNNVELTIQGEVYEQ